MQDRASTVSQLPSEMHAQADKLAAAGFNWQQILAIIQAILAGVGPLLKPPTTP